MALIKIFWERGNISKGVLPIECLDEEVNEKVEFYKKKCLMEESGRKITEVKVYKLLNEEKY
jgi:hypothetical protein